MKERRTVARPKPLNADVDQVLWDDWRADCKAAELAADSWAEDCRELVLRAWVRAIVA